MLWMAVEYRCDQGLWVPSPSLDMNQGFATASSVMIKYNFRKKPCKLSAGLASTPSAAYLLFQTTECLCSTQSQCPAIGNFYYAVSKIFSHHIFSFAGDCDISPYSWADQTRHSRSHHAYFNLICWYYCPTTLSSSKFSHMWKPRVTHLSVFGVEHQVLLLRL